MGFTELWVEFPTFLKEHLRLQIVCGCEFEKVINTEVITFPGVQIRSRDPRHLLAFGCTDFRLKTRHNFPCDFVLHRENIFQITVITVRPLLTSGVRVNQLRGHPYSFSRLANTAFNHVTDAKVPRHLSNVNRRSFVFKGRVSCDYIEPAIF